MVEFERKIFINVNKEVFEESGQWIDSKPEEHKYVEFLDTNDGTVMYLLGHGDEKGNIDASGQLHNPGRWLIANVDRLIEMGVKTILTISCYGGRQKIYKYKGVTIAPLHTSPFTVYIQRRDGVNIPMTDGRVVGPFALTISNDIPSDGPCMRGGKNLYMRYRNLKEKFFARETIDIQEALDFEARKNKVVS